MKVLLQAVDANGRDILGTEYNYIKECKSLSSLMRTNYFKQARKNIDSGKVKSYRIEEFTYSDVPKIYFTIS